MFYVEVLCFAVPINSRLCKLVTGGKVIFSFA